jgi:hypothetical protein
MSNVILIRKPRRLTKIERQNPRLTVLAAQLGGEITQRQQAFWFGDVQLSYTKRGDRVLTFEENAALAEEILGRIVTAREQPAWGTPVERARRVLHGLRTEMAPNFRDRHFNTWRHESLDEGVLWRSPMTYTHTAQVHLVGEPQIEVRLDGPGFTSVWGAVLDELAAQVEQQFGTAPGAHS